VPMLERDPPKALRLQRVTPGPEPPRDIRREPDVGAWREDPFEVPPPLQEWDLEEGLAVDLQEIERGEDLATPELPRVRVSLVVDLEFAFILPIVDQDAVDDGGLALGFCDARAIMPTPARNSLLGVHRGSRICASSVGPPRAVPLPFTTARRGGIRILARAASRVLTLRRATTGTANGRPGTR